MWLICRYYTSGLDIGMYLDWAISLLTLYQNNQLKTRPSWVMQHVLRRLPWAIIAFYSRLENQQYSVRMYLYFTRCSNIFGSKMVFKQCQGCFQVADFKAGTMSYDFCLRLSWYLTTWMFHFYSPLFSLPKWLASATACCLSLKVTYFIIKALNCSLSWLVLVLAEGGGGC